MDSTYVRSVVEPVILRVKTLKERGSFRYVAVPIF